MTDDDRTEGAMSGRALASEPPPTFDEFRLIRRLGAGAMGEVYLAEDLLLQRAVAVKFVRAHADANPAASERFYTEARAIARLQHPNVVAVYRVGRVRRRPYLVSEYVAGASLDRVALPLPAARVVEIGAALASGLAAAHRRGVLHRDIKPANVVVSETGDIKLLDFGLAKLLDAIEPPGVAPDVVDLDADADASPVTTEATATNRACMVADTPPHSGVRTRPGTLLGSPLYMAPELWRGEPATVVSDVYALGVLLYELCAGQPPFAGLALEELPWDRPEHEVPPLLIAAPTVPAELAAVIDHCVRWHPGSRVQSADALRRDLDMLRVGGAASRAPVRVLEPYRGLQPFSAEHRAVFFGRDVDARAIVDRLRADPFVLVVGDSGVGKSSLCAAGVLPQIADGGLQAGSTRSWSSVELVPGRHPLTALARALTPVLEGDEDVVLASLRAEPGEVDRALQRRLGPDRGLVIFVDQLEELLSVSDPAEAAQAAVVLGELAIRRSNRRLLASARSDFLTRLTTLPSIGGDIATALYLVGPLTRDGVHDAIVGPARACGVELESEALVGELADAAAGGDGLPMLQFALSALWDARDRERKILPARALEALGGVAGALVGHADRLLARLGPSRRAAVQRILLGLVTTDGTRIKRTAAELDVSPDAQAVLEALVRGRLVIAREGDRDGPATYELAHEVLVSAWDTLRAWMSGDLERRAARERLDRAAREWDRLGRPLDALWGRRQLDEVTDVDPAGLDPRTAEFAETSRRAVRRQRVMRRGLGVGAVLAVALSYAAVRIQADRALSSRVNERLVPAALALASAGTLDAQIEELRDRALNAYDDVPYRDADALKKAEVLWAELGTLTAKRDDHYELAEPALLAALALDSSRGDTREHMSALLDARALAADRSYRLVERDHYLARRRAFDRDGAGPIAAATIAIDTVPSGARVELARYTDGERRHLGAFRYAGTTPLSAVELTPGSYLFTLAVPDRAPVRYPVLLARGEQLRVKVEVPAAVPAGMVYVPAGRFLYGSGDVEAMRAFSQAQPLHAVELPGYFIGRSEVTFAEWIEFLRSRSVEERRRRTQPATDEGEVRLEEVDGGWRLTLQAAPGGPKLTAMSGERLLYPERDRRNAQDWLRFPVVGISWDDIVAYAQWLDHTAQVPGARPCDEREWERAARGADDRHYSHGDVLGIDDANFDLTYEQKLGAFGPDEVGSHPESDSPFGVADMVGNAYEQARSLQIGQVMLCGASFYRDKTSNQVIGRSVGTSDLRAVQNGARICADAPHSELSKEP